MNRFYYLIFAGLLFNCSLFASVTFKNKSNIKITFNDSEPEVVHTAIDIFSEDYNRVFNGKVINDKEGIIFVSTIDKIRNISSIIDQNSIDELTNRKETFILKEKNGRLYIIGSDKRGTAYGVLELSRMIGISPWEWWADSPIKKKKSFLIADNFTIMEYPSVEHRGIFINDEDWGLMPWSNKNYDPKDIKGMIGAKTHARIFELLLRLRANTFWPAMHECSIPFFLTPDNKKTADKYGIFIGTSHCEPMLRNTNGEWRVEGEGKYDFVNNRDNVLAFWEKRVKELAKSDNIYTLGIRGVHDSKMLGANTLEEQKTAINEIIKEQRRLIEKYVDKNIENVSQVFIPYKEVLDVYNMGLQVPDDVSLMWCDDNYGYIRHFPTRDEQMRKGGNGIYYHISYWGRPHDYLWLATTHPAQIYTQMKCAYNHGVRNTWILNVGDIKPAEYLIELFMDMAWNIDSIDDSEEGLQKHLYDWYNREFDSKKATKLVKVMNEYYRLAYIHKPEFMGNTRTEEKDSLSKIVKDLPWSEKEIRDRLKEYDNIEREVIKLSKSIDKEKYSSWFQLVEYPVRCASQINRKLLYAQLARHRKENWNVSDDAYDNIVKLTKEYNSLYNSKWKGMMDYQPRKLAVYDKVTHENINSEIKEYIKPLLLINGKEFSSFKGNKPKSHGLGYQSGAISLTKNSSVNYKTSINGVDSIRIVVTLAPNHPVEGNEIRFAISGDEIKEQIISYKTEGRSEEWKKNVLNNQATRIITINLHKRKNKILTIRAVDEGVVLDQIIVYRL